MRHVRMLGLGLAVAAAVTAFSAASALAKSPYTVETFTQYAHCPYNNPALNEAIEQNRLFCFYGQTLPGSKGGFFSLGNVTVPLNKPVVIQGAFVVKENEEREIEGYETEAAEGAETLESPELKVKGGIKLITSSIEQQAGWPQELKESFKEAVKNKETGLDVKIEVAGGNLLYETPDSVDVQNLIEESGTTFLLPLKTKVTGPWLAKLGGGPCQIGNDEHPIMQNLTSEAPGWASAPGQRVQFGHEFATVGIPDSKLVDLSWPVEAASDATGCGGAYESYVDAAMNIVLGLPHQRGTTILQGSLYDGKASLIREELGH